MGLEVGILCVCVCVCVCARERESMMGESEENHHEIIEYDKLNEITRKKFT